MSLLSTSALTARVETHLSTGDLQDLIDAIESEITNRIGGPYIDTDTAISETHMGNGRYLYLKRKMLTVDSVTEYSGVGSAANVLTADTDYSTWPDRGMLERVGGWGWKVVVSYVPQNDRRAWREAVIDLARLDIARMPMAKEGIQGEMSYEAPANWEHERAKIIHRLMFVEV